MKPITDALYSTLTPEERARLAIAALARGDNGEAARLLATCPEETTRGPERAYRRAADALTLAAWWAECEGRGMLIDLLLSRRHDTGESALAKVAALKGCAEAWHAFCGEIGLEPHALALATTGEPSRWLIFADLLATTDTPADPSARDGMLTALRAAVSGQR